MKTLVVVAHGDDEVLGCGGVLAQNICPVTAVVCGGALGRQGVGHSESAAGILNKRQAWRIKFGHFCDQSLDTATLTTVVSWVEAAVKEFSPETVYTHWSGDLNRDHRIVSEAVSVACRPYASSVKRLLHFEVPSSTEWGLTGFKPNTFVDISDTIETKIQAMQCYETEVREPPHPRSPDSMRARAKYWGQQVGMEYAEPFVLIRDCR